MRVSQQPAGHLQDHVGSGHPLSTQQAFQHIGALTRGLIAYRSEHLWQADLQRLPKPLAQLRLRTRQFAEQHLLPHALALDAAAHRPPGELGEPLQGILQAAAKAGLLSDVLPQPLGSAPLPQFRYPLTWQQAVKVEELSAACAGIMLFLSAHSLGLAPIALSGDLQAVHRFLLPALRDNRRGHPHLFAFAITEPAAGSDVEDGHGASLYRPGVVARRSTGGWLLNGRKCYISGGDSAHSLTLFAALEGEGMESWTCFLVRADMPGFRAVRNELKMGMRASSASELELVDVLVPDSHIIGGLRKGWALNRATLNYSRFPVAAMGVGLARRATEEAMDFACRSQLGGKALIEYQEVQLSIAQMVAETSAIRALVWQQANRFTPRQGEASLNKFHCTDVALRVCEMAMDLLGNHAMPQRNQVEKCYRDARLTQIFEGTNQINRLSLIEDMQDELLTRMQNAGEGP